MVKPESFPLIWKEWIPSKRKRHFVSQFELININVIFRPIPTVWGERLPFNTVCGEFSTPAGGWVHGVSFSPSGDALAFVGKIKCLTLICFIMIWLISLPLSRCSSISPRFYSYDSLPFWTRISTSRSLQSSTSQSSLYVSSFH